MLETVSIPILLKAVEFLFDEGKKILEERRERRKAQNTASEEKIESSSLKNSSPEETPETEVIKIQRSRNNNAHSRIRLDRIRSKGKASNGTS